MLSALWVELGSLAAQIPTKTSVPVERKKIVHCKVIKQPFLVAPFRANSSCSLETSAARVQGM